MKIVKILILVLILVILIFAGIASLNMLETGTAAWDGREMKEILNVDPQLAKSARLLKMSRENLMQLFYAAEAPSFAEMNGEYHAILIPAGVQAPIADFYAHHVMGPGRWEAKAFFPFGADKGWGYNVFSGDEEGTRRHIRTMKMDTYVGPSRFDKKNSFHLVYEKYNGGLNHTMRDEIRKINDRLFLGVGCIAWNFDTTNPSFFILVGNPAPWVGPDGGQ